MITGPIYSITGRERRKTKKPTKTNTKFNSPSGNRTQAIRFTGMSSTKHPRNTRGNIIGGGVEHSKNNLRGITYGIRLLWGIYSLT